MNIDGLRVFCEVARQRSFSRAAHALHMTQSAASQAVQHLERELGQQLFDRSHRPPQLTPAGDKFFETSIDILERLDQTVTQMREMENDVVGPVHVASIYSIGLYHPDEVKRFMERYPKANVRLQYLRPNLVIEAVLGGEATLGLVSYPKESREIAVVNWLDEEMVLACPPRHRLATARSVTLAELQGEKFVAFDEDLTIRKKVDAALAEQDVEVQVVMEFDNIETIKQAVQVGMGIAILPAATVSHLVESGTLASVPLDPPSLTRPVGIIHRRGRPLSLACVKFVESLTGRPLMGSGTRGDVDILGKPTEGDPRSCAKPSSGSTSGNSGGGNGSNARRRRSIYVERLKP